MITGYAAPRFTMPVMSEDERRAMQSALVALREANKRLDRLDRAPMDVLKIRETAVVCAVLHEAIHLLRAAGANNPERGEAINTLASLTESVEKIARAAEATYRQ